MTTLTLSVQFTYDEQLMHGDSEKGREWFRGVLLGDALALTDHGDVGDNLGAVKVLEITDGLSITQHIAPE